MHAAARSCKNTTHEQTSFPVMNAEPSSDTMVLVSSPEKLPSEMESAPQTPPQFTTNNRRIVLPTIESIAREGPLSSNLAAEDTTVVESPLKDTSSKPSPDRDQKALRNQQMTQRKLAREKNRKQKKHTFHMVRTQCHVGSTFTYTHVYSLNSFFFTEEQRTVAARPKNKTPS